MRTGAHPSRFSGLHWGALLLGLCAALAAAQESSPDARGISSSPSLIERQRLVRERIDRLESSMLKLSGLLAESEPAKAERLRDALEFVGHHRIKARAAQLTELLERGEVGRAETHQEALLADLDALLALLTSSLNEADRRRAERQRLEAYKQSIRDLMDAQTRILYRTQHAARGGDAPPTGGAADAALEEQLRQLEHQQRTASADTDDLRRRMKTETQPAHESPGQAEIERAAAEMRQATGALHDRQPQQAEDEQRQALQELQQALDELDDALRQVRREEAEETLAALEARFRSMLSRERDVAGTIRDLRSVPADAWGRVHQLHLSEASQMQQRLQQDCDDTRRILVDEGTTIIVPELLAQMSGDMGEIIGYLERADVSESAAAVAQDVISLLEEVLAAIEQKRQQNARAEGPPSGQPPEGQKPLLPGSAELKLLRSAQLRMNNRTQELAERGAGQEAALAAELARLGIRQRRLAELATLMNERVP